MKVINATWDEKVTGLRTCEILFERGDTFESYLNSELEKYFKFLVAKIPVSDLKLVQSLEDIGYRYLENQMRLSFEINQLEKIDPVWMRLLKGFTFKQVTSEDEISGIESEVKDKMFEADRFTLDPFWSTEISSLRYTNWIRELYKKKGTKLYEIEHNGDKSGFFVIREESQKANSCPIAGIYNRYKGAGHIFVISWLCMYISRNEGKTKIYTSVSSNNRTMLSSLSKAFTFRLSENIIVMRKVVI